MAVKFTNLLGITGVHPGERVRALLWAQRLEWPILLVALWIPIQWYLEETGAVSLSIPRYFDWAIWAIFLFETVLLTSLVSNKKRYLFNNWMNLVIIIGGFPLVWPYTPLVGALRDLRLLMMMFILVRISRRLRQFLARGRLGTTLAIAAIVVVLAGIIVTRLDRSMGTVWDGMWYSWVTISHTGYGDIVPRTPAARLFGGVLILLGVVLFTVLTASLSAFLIGTEVEKVEKEEFKADVMLKDILTRLERIEQKLEDKQ